MGWLQELDGARGRQWIGRPALSTPRATGRQTTTARTTGRRTLSAPPRAGRQPLLLATDVGRGKPRPLSTLLPLHPAPLLSTLHRPNSTSSRRRLTSLPGVDFSFHQDSISSLRDQRQERSIVVE